MKQKTSVDLERRDLVAMQLESVIEVHRTTSKNCPRPWQRSIQLYVAAGSQCYDGRDVAMVDTGGAAMTDEVYTQTRSVLASKMNDLVGGAKDMLHASLREAMAWDLYKWTVLALMTATFLLVALSYGGIRAELATLKEARGTANESLANIGPDLDRQISELRASLTQSISTVKTGLDTSLAKINAKLDAKNQPKPAQPAARPKRQ